MLSKPLYHFFFSSPNVHQKHEIEDNRSTGGNTPTDKIKKIRYHYLHAEKEKERKRQIKTNNRKILVMACAYAYTETVEFKLLLNL